MIRRPPRSTQSRSSAASDVYKRQLLVDAGQAADDLVVVAAGLEIGRRAPQETAGHHLSLIHISEPTRPY